MSRAGAVAMREAAKFAQLADEGLESASKRAYEERTAKKVEQAKKDIVRLLLPLIGPVTEEPFVLDDFADFYSEEGRVCVRVDGLLFNYYAASGKNPASVSVIDGVCSECGERPRLMVVHELADLGSLFTKWNRKAREEFKCYVCRARR